MKETKVFQDQFALDEGPVILQVPVVLSMQSRTALNSFFDLILERAERNDLSGKKPQAEGYCELGSSIMGTLLHPER